MQLRACKNFSFLSSRTCTTGAEVFLRIRPSRYFPWQVMFSSSSWFTRWKRLHNKPSPSFFSVHATKDIDIRIQSVLFILQLRYCLDLKGFLLSRNRLLNQACWGHNRLFSIRFFYVFFLKLYKTTLSKRFRPWKPLGVSIWFPQSSR